MQILFYVTILFYVVFLSNDCRAEKKVSEEPPQVRETAASLKSIFKRYRIFYDIDYLDKPESKSQKLDLYVPKKAGKLEPVPVVIWIHGGGWSAGDKRFGPFVPLLKRDFAVASINYRLSQEAKFPAQIHDCKRAVLWVKRNASRYNLDPARVGVWGASAGGHLSALLGATSSSDSLEKEKESRELNSDVQAVCDWFGPVNLSPVVKHDKGSKKYEVHRLVQELLGVDGRVLVEATRQASPVTYITPKAPPTLIMHGDRDKLVALKQSKEFYDKLKACNVDVQFETISGGHGFPGFGPLARQKVVEFFSRVLSYPGKREDSFQSR